MNHNYKVHCKECLRKKMKASCESFQFMSDPILDDEGYCLAYVDDEEEYKRLKNELRCFNEGS